METLVAEADGAGGAGAVPAAQLGAGLSDVHVVDRPALLLSFVPLLDPAELCGAASSREQEGFRRLECPTAVSSLQLWEWSLFLSKGLPKLLPPVSTGRGE